MPFSPTTFQSGSLFEKDQAGLHCGPVVIETAPVEKARVFGSGRPA